MRLAETLRSTLKRHAIPHSESSTAIVTASIGVANMSDTFLSSAELVGAAADEALYAAKKHGRDRVEAAAEARAA
ncbi:diguanylate cyclase [Rhizobium leguminosarum]|uniref:diguanylate cyclase n=1 Tax=Rhizobium leguminosarum TaxID=384 RepID=UPI001FD8A805|nr:diguanylate cyclase [Rhizobium leguminosarum]